MVNGNVLLHPHGAASADKSLEGGWPSLLIDCFSAALNVGINQLQVACYLYQNSSQLLALHAGLFPVSALGCSISLRKILQFESETFGLSFYK